MTERENLPSKIVAQDEANLRSSGSNHAANLVRAKFCADWLR